jgi:hypothetical protein
MPSTPLESLEIDRQTVLRAIGEAKETIGSAEQLAAATRATLEHMEAALVMLDKATAALKATFPEWVPPPADEQPEPKDDYGEDPLGLRASQEGERR